MDDAYLIHYQVGGGQCGILGPWLHMPTNAEMDTAVSGTVTVDFPSNVVYEIKTVELFGDFEDGYTVTVL